MGFREIEATADIGIEVWAKSYENLIEEALNALFFLSFDLNNVEKTKSFEVEVEGIDEVDLLITALNEAIFLIDAKKFVFKEAKVSKISENKVKIRLYGEPFDPKKHTKKNSIKAATYHMCYIEREDDKLKTKIIFDV